VALYGRTKPERCYASQEDAQAAAAVDEEDAETPSRSARRFQGASAGVPSSLGWALFQRQTVGTDALR
jgi:hypothetical protein